ncbi:hypothetical protein JTE90_013338 [Oedothorax gibbosus]|uniref:Uncharacterized protein n=1 Tax=Oedothorax gibbosus TaxID=931172 RepID=A0AAV6VEW1_9ARAC|nr:hypothetical protein JTE90_013338 [Oedothorax gibbosus]
MNSRDNFSLMRNRERRTVRGKIERRMKIVRGMESPLSLSLTPSMVHESPACQKRRLRPPSKMAASMAGARQDRHPRWQVEIDIFLARWQHGDSARAKGK